MSASNAPRLGGGARIHLYRELQTMTTAGIPIVTAISQLTERNRGTLTVRVLEDFGAALRSGAPMGEAAQKARLADPFELALFRVGESVGDLHPLFQHMIDRLERERELARRVLVGLIYPILLIHVAILLVPLHTLFGAEGSLGKYLLRSFVPLGILYTLAILGYLLRRPLGGVIDSVGMHLPVLGKIKRQAELTRFFSALEPLYAAGIPIGDAVRQAAGTCGSPTARAVGTRVADRIDAGKPLSEALKGEPLFPPDCQGMVETAERSGDMQPTFKVLFKQHEGNLKHSLKIVSIVVPILVFGGVAVYIGWLVVSFWVGYYNRILPS